MSETHAIKRRLAVQPDTVAEAPTNVPAKLEAAEPPVTDAEAQRARDVLPHVLMMVDELKSHRRRVPRAHFESVDTGSVSLKVDFADSEALGDIALMFSLGTREAAFLNGLVKQIANLGGQGRYGGAPVMDFLLATVKGIEPKDQVEAMLAAQMAAVHLVSMHMASCVMDADTLPIRESTERAFNRLARTFVAQTEALKRYRTGGEQKVTVQHQHVTVNDGGPAMVATVNAGGREQEEK